MLVRATPAYLQSIGKDTYYELLVLDDLSTITRYSIELDHSLGTIRKEQAILYKFGEPCPTLRIKNDKAAVQLNYYLKEGFR